MATVITLLFLCICMYYLYIYVCIIDPKVYLILLISLFNFNRNGTPVKRETTGEVFWILLAFDSLLCVSLKFTFVVIFFLLDHCTIFYVHIFNNVGSPNPKDNSH